MFGFFNRLQALLVKKIWYTTNHVCRHDINYTITSLCRTLGGKYILMGRMPNCEPSKLHWLIFGNGKLAYPKVQPLTDAEAREWAISVHMDTDRLNAFFGVVAE